MAGAISVGVVVASIAGLWLVGRCQRTSGLERVAKTAPIPAPAARTTVARAPEPSRPARKPRRATGQLTVPLRGQDPLTKRMLVSVTINGTTQAIMAFDSAAPSTEIAPSLAEHLGLLREDESKLFDGASGGATPPMLVLLDSLALDSAREEVVPVLVGHLADRADGVLGKDFVSTFDAEVDTARQVLLLATPEVSEATPAGHDEAWWRQAFHQLKDQRQRWEVFREQADRRLADSPNAPRPILERFRRLRAIADHRLRELPPQTARLDQHATKHHVPPAWR